MVYIEKGLSCIQHIKLGEVYRRVRLCSDYTAKESGGKEEVCLVI